MTRQRVTKWSLYVGARRRLSLAVTPCLRDLHCVWRAPRKCRSIQEYCLAAVALEEPLRTRQAFGGDEDVASPTQDKGARPLAANPVAYLVPGHGPQDTEGDGIPDVRAALLGQEAGRMVSPGIGTPALSSITLKKTIKYPYCSMR